MIYSRYLVLFILCILYLPCAQAQAFDSTLVVAEDYQAMDTSSFENDAALIKPEELPGAKSYSQENIDNRKISEDQWKNVVGDQRFEENEIETPKKKDRREIPIPDKPWDSNILRMISFIILILIVLALVFVVLRNINLDNRIKKNALMVQQIEDVDDIENLEVDSLMTQAINTKNFRLGVRLLYLDLLKMLHEKKIILWKKDKTNFDYLTELRSENFASEVSGITFNYERIWYGEREANENTFYAMREACMNVYGQLNKSNK